MAGQEHQLHTYGDEEGVELDYQREARRTQAARLMGGYFSEQNIDLSQYDPNDGLPVYAQEVGFGD